MNTKIDWRRVQFSKAQPEKTASQLNQIFHTVSIWAISTVSRFWTFSIFNWVKYLSAITINLINQIVIKNSRIPKAILMYIRRFQVPVDHSNFQSTCFRYSKCSYRWLCCRRSYSVCRLMAEVAFLVAKKQQLDNSHIKCHWDWNIPMPINIHAVAPSFQIVLF